MFRFVDLLSFSTLAQSRSEIQAQRYKQLHFSSARQLRATARQYIKTQLGSREDFFTQIKYLKFKRPKNTSQSHQQERRVCLCICTYIQK